MLVLDYEERQALDWVGMRYDHGSELKYLLLDSMEGTEEEKALRALAGEGESAETWWRWADKEVESIEFRLREHEAWEVLRIRDECEGRWDCFGKELAEKLEEFCDGVV